GEPHVVHAVDKCISGVGSGHADVAYAQGLRVRGDGTHAFWGRWLNDVGVRRRDWFADRAGYQGQGGARGKGRSRIAHCDFSTGSLTFCGGPPIRAPAGYRLIVADSSRRLSAVTRRSRTMTRTSY